jgi:hypothetical protein
VKTSRVVKGRGIVESWGGGVVADLGMRTLEVNRDLFHICALQESALLLITESSIP